MRSAGCACTCDARESPDWGSARDKRLRHATKWFTVNGRERAKWIIVTRGTDETSQNWCIYMKSLLNRFVGWLRNDSAEPPFTADVRVDSGFGVLRGAENIFHPTKLVVVVAFGHEASGVVVVEGEDEATRLWHRVAYVYSEKTGLIDHIVATWAKIPNPSNTETIRSPVKEPDYLQNTFGFQQYIASDPLHRMSLDEAEALVSTKLGNPLVYQFDDKEIPYDREGVLVSNELFYIPYTWIRCVGYLVNRATSEVIGLGSGMSVEIQIWAWYRGLKSTNDLEILSVHDRVELESVLREVMGNYRFRTEVAPRIETLPCVVENLPLHYACEQLRRAEINHWYRFRILSKASDSVNRDVPE